MRKRMQGLLVALAVAYLASVALLVLLEDRLVFFPQVPGRLVGDWHPPGLGVEDVWLTTSDGVKLHSWWIAAPGARFTFLMFHGNAANLPNRAEIYRFFHALPANVLAVEYRGYGRSEGRPGEDGLYLDARAAHDHLTGARGIPARRIVAYGASLGSAVATDLAVHREVGALVLEAPFPSAAAVAKRIYWFLPGLSLLLRSRFDSAAKLPEVRAPVLIVHCAGDPVLPIALGRATRAAAPGATFLELGDHCHEDASLLSPEPYRDAVRALLASVRP